MEPAPGAEDRAGRVQIGAVVRELKDEFPDVSISKIRFLEGEGLVRPTRAESGYRYFSHGDIERIRFILRAQRDRFWPLRVIAETLEKLDRGLVPPEVADEPRPHVPDVTGLTGLPQASDLTPSAERLRLTAAEVAEAAGLDDGYVQALVGYGLLTKGSDGYLGADAVVVARAAAQLAARGLEARHLRPFRLAADREIALTEQTSHAIRGEQARGAAVEEILQECIALHVALVRAGLGDHRA